MNIQRDESFYTKSPGPSGWLKSIKNIHMKQLVVLVMGLLFSASAAMAQKYIIIDTRYIFDKMPEYKQVQNSIDKMAATWQKEIDLKQEALDKAYDEYDSQGTMLSADAKRKKEDDLFNKERELRDLQKQRFGFEGDLFKKRQELMAPLQEKVNRAVQKLVIDRGYDLVLDKSEGKSIIFADPKLDKSDEVLKLLSVK
ncbi:periplasmic chaperone for outer membrane proteins Skp [Niabella drilacis]|uniref:Periplasmic chaperone for outer membrane proteins Skp n=2 Tax=Niabella drilacis (strain DSM 25811 / CCM 8410 / CCUG 62505 / LMG 26954 / E90) TaxID=1285928 RepID=A0A1G6Q7U7_NIADE|nr:periplasmic chaperone for outer membrane proteins Skp [Niabella drilacis]